MVSAIKTKHISTAPGLSVAADAYSWANPYGGAWGVAANWTDATTGTVAASAPGSVNTVTISGGAAGNFTNITGTGAAAQLAINGDVLSWGTVAVAGEVTLGASADLDLDGGAALTTAGMALANGATLEVGNGSTVTSSGVATLAGGMLIALNGGVVQVGGLIANGATSDYVGLTGLIAVDDASSIEVGAAGGAALGAVTIDAGATAAAVGSIDGNMVVNGALAVQGGGSLAVDITDPFGSAQAIGGAGVLTLGENSRLSLGVADSAAIAFGGPNGTLALGVLATGTIAGFAAGDVIELLSHGRSSIATGLSVTQTGSNTAALTLLKGGQAVGTLTVAGNYASSLFHLTLDSWGNGFVTLQTIGAPPTQPSQIIGTAGYDVLIATAANQTITGYGGNDLLSAAGFTGVTFQDTSGNLNGSAVIAFVASDVIDLTDVNLGTASYSYTQDASGDGTLAVSDGTHAATVGLAFSNGLAPGYFTSGTDGAGGTDISYIAVNMDLFTLAASPANYGTAAAWQDITTGTLATAAPSYGNPVTIAGGTGSYTDVSGNGFAANLTTSGSVLLWGSLNAGSKLADVTGVLAEAGTLALDGGAKLVLAGSVSASGLIEVGGASALTAAGGLMFADSGGSLMAFDRSSVRIASLLASADGGWNPSVIGVDSSSYIVIGSTGTATVGALSIQNGITANLAGAINGNVVLNGILNVAGTLAIGSFGTTVPAISGTGTIELDYGGWVSIAGSDSAAIQFNQAASGSYASTTETLVLGASIPTGVITGLSPGDVITVGLVVTNLSYTQVGTSGRLTLLNGGTTLGVLLLSGNYVASQFQVQPGTAAQSSLITYAPPPSTAVGNAVSGTTDAYSWVNTAGGIWGNANNWTDTTLGSVPTSAPGASNPVTISDTTGAYTPQIISAPGAAASLTISSAADTILIGVISVTGQFSVNNYGTPSGQVALYGNSNLSAGSLSVTSLLRLTSASLLSVLGTTGGTFISGSLVLGSGSVMRVYGGSSVITGSVSVDTSSLIEIGSAGTGTSGNLTIDNGQTLTLQGSASLATNLAVNGVLNVFNGTIQGFAGSVGAITGNGSIVIGALGSSGYLTLNSTDTATIYFQLYSVNSVPYAFETLELKSPLSIGQITGFIAGDTIVIDRNVTGATFVQTYATQGTLTLTNGSATVGTLRLNGSFSAYMFQVDIAPGTGVATITLQPKTSAATAVTGSGSDSDSWTGASGGTWSSASNWKDITTGTAASTAPASGNTVLIGGVIGTGQYTTIGGNGSAAVLTVTGNVLLTGQVAIGGSVHVSTGNGPAAVLTLENGAQMTAGGSAEVFGRMEFGGGSTATVASYAVLFGGSLLVLNGSVVQAGGLIGDSAGDVLGIDGNSSLNIGTSNGVAGTLTISASAPAEFAGNIYGSVIDNGRLWVSAGGTLFIDMSGTVASDPYGGNPTIGGTGVLTLDEGSTLGLGVACSAAIQFMGPNATLTLVAIPTGAIYGFAAGDQIQIDHAVNGLIYQQVNASAGVLTLTNGNAVVGQLVFAGSYGGGVNAFHVDASPGGNTARISLQSLLTTPAQMSFLQGTVGSDNLSATANGQTITGNGGGDILSGGGFTNIDFKDYTAYLSGSAIQNFMPGDMVDFIDMNPATATLSYSNTVLAVTDGTHSASLSLTFASTPTSGGFHMASDGTGGTKLTWS